MAIPVLPESAPFSPTQRAWLNGFLAGLLNVDEAHAASPAKVGPITPEPEPDAEDFPWHDAGLSMDERMALADGKPAAQRLMACMAQLDCGACGYLCQTYAEALASGAETSLRKCAPGGVDTVKMLKKVIAEGEASMAPGAEAAEVARTSPRDCPVGARVVENRLLNASGSTKDTRLIRLEVSGTGLRYKVGDSLGIYPHNPPEVVERVLARLGCSGEEEVRSPKGRNCSLRAALTADCDLGVPDDGLFRCLMYAAPHRQMADELRELIKNPSFIPEAEHWHVADALSYFKDVSIDAQALVKELQPLEPRLYSISSSPLEFPDEVHLTVGVVRYQYNGTERKGVASSYLAAKAVGENGIKVFVQPSHGFDLPKDDRLPVIMVGPGTGVAPFRAFLQERKARKAQGENWLFFGDQRADFDFLYREELESYRTEGILHRLDVAFSRDQAEKVYVQHRMLENGPALWDWLQRGAYFFVCGDAGRMAKDVDAALHEIVAAHGGMTAAQAKAYVADLKKAGRYQRDVY